MEGKLIKETDGSYCLIIIHERIGNMIIATDNKDLNDMLNYPYNLSLKNCEAIENGYDLDELAYTDSEEFVDNFDYNDGYGNICRFNNSHEVQECYIKGFQKALEILGDKKFSINEVVELCKILMSNPFEKCGKSYQELTDNYIQSLQQTEWDVEIEMEKYVKYVPKVLETVFPTLGIRPKLDADSCLILKRI